MAKCKKKFSRNFWGIVAPSLRSVAAGYLYIMKILITESQLLRAITKRPYQGSKNNRDYFIDRAHEVHGDEYDYDNVYYLTNKDKVMITCPKHGDFAQRPADHIAGYGCPKCKADDRRMSFKSFLNKARAAHGDKYNYDDVDYVASDLPVKINCPVHGGFMQRPDSHFAGRGCSRCYFDSRKKNK